MDQFNPETGAPAATESKPETAERSHENRVEASEEQIVQGAEMLEEPQNGSFVSALQVFAAWVKNLLANDK